MDWSCKFENLQNEIKGLSERADKLAQAYAEAEDFTRRFLTQCSKHNIKLVSIGMRTELIDECNDYPFDPHGSVFAEGRTKDGWSSIWEVVRELDISGGAGNKFQHQVSYDAEVKLVDGVYEFKDKKWHKIR